MAKILADDRAASGVQHASVQAGRAEDCDTGTVRANADIGGRSKSAILALDYLILIKPVLNWSHQSHP